MPASLSAAFFAMAESSQSPRSASQCVQRGAPTVVFAIIWDALARFIRMISAGHLGDEASSLELGSRQKTLDGSRDHVSKGRAGAGLSTAKLCSPGSHRRSLWLRHLLDQRLRTVR